MFTARRFSRSAIVSALACAALIAAVSSALAATSVQRPQAPLSPTAVPQDDLRSADARAAAAPLAQERYYSTAVPQDGLRSADARAAAAPLAQERYYSSYGEPAPLSVPQSPVPADDTPWLPVALVVAAALAIAGVSATRLRRLRIRRRNATRIAT